VHQRMCRMPHSYPSEPRPGGRNRAIAVVRGSKFGTGLTGEGRPGTAGTKRAKTRPGGRVAGRPPARGLRPGRGTALAGRGTALAGRGTAPAGRGRRTGEAGRRARRQVLLQVGASTVRSAGDRPSRAVMVLTLGGGRRRHAAEPVRGRWPGSCPPTPWPGR
jgi:hypothetical protein